MRRLNIYPRSAGDKVELRVQPNSKFASCVVFVRKHTATGSNTESSHSPGPNGEISVKLTLQPCKGYDLIFVGVPLPAAGASIKYEIAFNTPLPGQLSGPESITKSVPSVGWTILV